MSLIDETNGYVVTVVTGRSMAEIEQIAHQRLHGLVRDVVGQPLPVDLSRLVDYALPQERIHFVPVNDNELPGMWAFAQPTGDVDDDIEVLIQDSEWTALHAGGRKAHHARGTVAHELGHVYLHVKQIRARIALGHGLPRQVDVREVKTYDNAEWQAWAFGGCFLAPRPSIIAANTLDPARLASIFMTSEKLMKMHLQRLGLIERTTRTRGWR
jgi:Zn-dependent peptidase ImmA (M78 family)